MYFLAILFPLAYGAAVDPDTLPKYMHNIEYFLRGYNVMKGNPHQTAVSAEDPGFQEAIFKLSYDKGTVTPDEKYYSPDGTLVTMCQACSLSAVTKKISGMNAYRDSLAEKVRISGGGCLWPWCTYSFSLSVDYKKVQAEINQYSNFYTHSDASCCAYQIQTDSYKLPPFSSDFLQGIITLPEDCKKDTNKALYRKFIESFGTNYIKQTDMGSLFGQEIKISKDSWKKMMNQSINIDWSSSWSLFFAYGNSEGQYDDQKKKVQLFHSFTESRSLYTKGSKPPKSKPPKSKLENWVQEAKKYPAPISLELGSILDLFTRLNVPQPIITCMNDTLYNYCDDQTCKGLNRADPEFPRLWQDWLTNYTMGVRSQPMFCQNGDYVTKIKLARGITWPWPTEGLYDLCFTCSTQPNDWKCFNGTEPPPTYWGRTMSCPTTGFKKMATYDTAFYAEHPINVKSQCYDDNLDQYAFSYDFLGTWGPWVECDAGKKIVGFQVQTKWDPFFGDRIMNYRFECA